MIHSIEITPGDPHAMYTLHDTDTNTFAVYPDASAYPSEVAGYFRPEPDWPGRPYGFKRVTAVNYGYDNDTWHHVPDGITLHTAVGAIRAAAQTSPQHLRGIAPLWRIAVTGPDAMGNGQAFYFPTESTARLAAARWIAVANFAELDPIGARAEAFMGMCQMVDPNSTVARFRGKAWTLAEVAPQAPELLEPRNR